MSDFNHQEKIQTLQYTRGHYDLRPWGLWVVTDVLDSAETTFCEKIICVFPGRILSLQSHYLRHEVWTVLAGTLQAVVNDELLTLEPGQQADIPRGVIHCMANLGGEPCIVKERQTGVCLESDIVRYMDAYGRVSGEEENQLTPSAKLYLSILEQIEGKQRRYA